MLRWFTRLYIGTVGAVALCAARRRAPLGLNVAVGIQATAIVTVTAMRWIEPRSTAFIARVRRTAHRTPHGQPDIDFRWVPIERISSSMQLAAIAGEDSYFALHSGFDWESMRSAHAHNRTSDGHRRGGSTISQQVAKNLFLWHEGSLVRKGLEAYLTALIESTWPKRRILEMYLNVAQFGPATFGAEAAAQRFFGVSACELDPSQSTLLVAVLPNPIARDVANPDSGMRFRQLLIRGNLHRIGDDYLERFGIE